MNTQDADQAIYFIAPTPARIDALEQTNVNKFLANHSHLFIPVPPERLKWRREQEKMVPFAEELAEWMRRGYGVET